VAASGQREGRKMEIRRTLTVVLAGALLCGCTVSSLAGQAEEPGMAASSPEQLWEQGREAYERKDDAEAVRWYRKAAEQGHAIAQHNLGVMYEEGQGVPQDFVSAYKWLNLAVSRYTADEASLRDAAIKIRDRMLARLTPAQIATAQQWALAWRPGLPTTPGTGDPSGKKDTGNGQ